MKIRESTEREKEIEKRPSCTYDPVETNSCIHYEFPPPREKCRRCLLVSVDEALAARENSEAMRWFIAYLKWTKVGK